MWDLGVRHCDLHWSNIMMLKSHIESPEVGDRILKRGLGVLPGLRWYYSEPPMTPTEFDQNVKRQSVQFRNNNRGIGVYMLHRYAVRFIDLAYVLDIRHKINTIRAEFPDDPHPEGRIDIPCRVYRPLRDEDITELTRQGLFYLFGKSNSPNRVFSAQLQRVKSKIPEAFDRFWNSNDVKTQKWKSELLAAVQHMEDTQLGFNTSAASIPALNSCLNNRAEYNKLSFDLIRKNRKDLGKYMRHKCTVQSSNEVLDTIIHSLPVLRNKYSIPVEISLPSSARMQDTNEYSRFPPKQRRWK
eukprot:GHVO01045668.1.p1 GENE.GHVO01045668.1~~GHVO01045668.1.p1  ORF type:complete len:320 (+),score=23.36 GHVO01045668.1:65-961(+)